MSELASGAKEALALPFSTFFCRRVCCLCANRCSRHPAAYLQLVSTSIRHWWLVMGLAQRTSSEDSSSSLASLPFKRCPSCNTRLPLHSFYTAGRSKTGQTRLHSHCKRYAFLKFRSPFRMCTLYAVQMRGFCDVTSCLASTHTSSDFAHVRNLVSLSCAVASYSVRQNGVPSEAHAAS